MRLIFLVTLDSLFFYTLVIANINLLLRGQLSGRYLDQAVEALPPDYIAMVVDFGAAVGGIVVILEMFSGRRACVRTAWSLRTSKSQARVM